MTCRSPALRTTAARATLPSNFDVFGRGGLRPGVGMPSVPAKGVPFPRRASRNSSRLVQVTKNVRPRLHKNTSTSAKKNACIKQALSH